MFWLIKINIGNYCSKNCNKNKQRLAKNVNYHHCAPLRGVGWCILSQWAPLRP